MKTAVLHSKADMFSAVPSNWRVMKLGFLVSMRSGEGITSESIRGSGDYPVFGGNGLRGYTDSFTHRGHYALIGRQGALCGNINYADGEFWASEHAIVATPRERVEVKWLGEALRAMDLNQYSVSAAQPGLSVDAISALKIGVPPLSEQRRIAAYLDAETKQIDALVAEKERMLGLLEEKRAAQVSRAVTRGLDPRAPLKPSGLEWLGRIPRHWEVRRAKFLFKQTSHPVEEGAEMVTCFRDGEVTLRKNRREEGFTNAILELGYQGVKAGQLVLHSMDAFAGAIGVSDSGGKCSPEYINCDPVGADVDPNFFARLLRVMALRGFIQAACPAVRERAPRIRFSNFAEMFLPVPPLAEQRAIVAYLAAERERTAELERTLRESITLLHERRRAIITAAVTGQIDPEAMSA